MRVFQHSLVQIELEFARSEWCELAEHDVLRDATNLVRLRVHRGLHEHVNSLLERAAHEGATVHPVDAVARDRQQVATERHDVAEDGKVTVVDVGAVKLDDGAQLTE